MQLKNIKAKSEFGTKVSEMLSYRRFEILSIADDMGIYEMADGRRGFIVQISPPSYLGSRIQTIINRVLESLAKEGNVIHISTYASKNLSREISRWKQLHHANVRVDNPAVLKNWVDAREEAYNKWTKQTMMRFGDVRLKNFVTTISVLTPYGATDDDIVGLYRETLAGLEKLSPSCFYPEDLIRMCSEILKPNADSWEAEYDRTVPINQQIGLNTELNISEMDRAGGTITIDSAVKMKNLTTVRIPERLEMYQHQQLFIDIFGDDIGVARPSSYFVSMTIAATADTAVDKTVSDREQLYETIYQIFVFEENETKLDQYCKALVKRFKLPDSGGWMLKPEKDPSNALNAFFSSLPLALLDSTRKRQLKNISLHPWTSSNAAAAPMISDTKRLGDFTNVFIGRTGQLVQIDWRAESNQNIIIIGPAGTGKSFLINELIMSAVTQGICVRAFDLGGSSKSVCQYSGGKHIELDLESDSCMNFFTNILEIKKGKDSIIDPAEFSTIIPLIGLMCKQELISGYHGSESDGLRVELGMYIQSAVELAYRRRGRASGMKEVVEALEKFKREVEADGDASYKISMLIDGLYDYGNRDGQYYHYFNGTYNIDISDYDLAVFEFEKLRHTRDFLYVAQAAIMQRIAVEFFYSRDVPTMFGLDEAKIMALNNILMFRYLENFVLRLRKYFCQEMWHPSRQM